MIEFSLFLNKYTPSQKISKKNSLHYCIRSLTAMSSQLNNFVRRIYANETEKGQNLQTRKITLSFDCQFRFIVMNRTYPT